MKVIIKYFVFESEFTREEALKLGDDPNFDYPNWLGEYKCHKCNAQLTPVHPFSEDGVSDWNKCINFKCENCYSIFEYE